MSEHGEQVDCCSGGPRKNWERPALRIYQIRDIIRLGLATDCDGGFGLNAIDGNAIGCNR